jgi:DNA-3-methyladenine glycosylase II
MMLPSRPAKLDSANLQVAANWLANRDSALAGVLARFGPPPLWKRPATFATLVRIILEQQVSLASAKAIFERLQVRCGGRITAATVQSIDEPLLRSLGLSRQKARYVGELARAVSERRFSVEGLRHCDDCEAARRIRALLGFGAWSADVYLMMALLRPDVLPVGDLGLIKGMEELDQATFSSSDEIRERAELWRPWRSVATRMIWQLYLVNRGKDVSSIASG